MRLALFYFIAAGVCQPIQAQSEFPFRLDRETIIVVSLMAGNDGPFDFVLDMFCQYESTSNWARAEGQVPRNVFSECGYLRPGRKSVELDMQLRSCNPIKYDLGHGRTRYSDQSRSCPDAVGDYRC
jgi:hypothetical protein